MGLIKESSTQQLYHWTTYQCLLSILQTQQIKPSFLERVSNNHWGGHSGNICFSRIRSVSQGFPVSCKTGKNLCLITFDGDYINSRGKVMAYDYWAMANPDKIRDNGRKIYADYFSSEFSKDPEFDNFRFKSQSEDRLFTDKPISTKNAIENISIITNWAIGYNIWDPESDCNLYDILEDISLSINQQNFVPKTQLDVLTSCLSYSLKVDSITNFVNNEPELERLAGDIPILFYRTKEDFDAKRDCSFADIVEDYKMVLEDCLLINKSTGGRLFYGNTVGLYDKICQILRTI